MNLTGLSFDDVLLRPRKGVLDSRRDADISFEYGGMKVPFFSAPMPSVASVDLIIRMIQLGGNGIIHRMNRTTAQMIEDYNRVKLVQKSGCPVAIGINYRAFRELYGAGAQVFVLDVAHAHSDKAIEFIKYMKMFPGVLVVAGSIATYDGALDLINVGADMLRVGVGPGSVCTTRQVTGFGVPQLQAIAECAEAAGDHDFNQFGSIPIIADGGIRNSGDIAKAIAAGASAVMIGNLFAHSIEANNGGKHYGNASKIVNGHNAPEGIETELGDDIEPLEDIVKRLAWGLRSAVSYAGGTKLEDLRDCEFIPLGGGARTESKL